MRVAEVAGLIGRETPAELFVRVLRAVVELDEIENQLVGDLAHSCFSHLSRKADFIACRFTTAHFEPLSIY